MVEELTKGKSEEESNSRNVTTGNEIQDVIRRRNSSEKTTQEVPQFDFGRFLQQMSHPSASYIAQCVKKYVSHLYDN